MRVDEWLQTDAPQTSHRERDFSKIWMCDAAKNRRRSAASVTHLLFSSPFALGCKNPGMHGDRS